MRIKINGEDVTDKRVVIETKEVSNSTAWLVIAIGVVACIGWWFIWEN